MLAVAAAGLLAVTFYYGVVFDGQLPDHRILRGKNDLFLHLAAFAVLTIPVWLLWQGRGAFGALVCCAALIEGIQIFQPGRTAAFDDFAASFAGIILGAALVMALKRGIGKFKQTNLE